MVTHVVKEHGPENPAQADEISFDGWTLRRNPREVLRNGEALRLQDQPLQILDELVTHPNQLVTREQLIARLWPKGVVDFDASLNTAMRKLRAALKDDADTPLYIETVPRQGYRFIGKITPLPVQTSGALNSKSDMSEPSTPGPHGVGQPKRILQWVAAIVLAIGIASIIFDFRSLVSKPHATAESTATQLRIAVLPFQNLSPDPDNAFFTDGLHDEILTALSVRAPDLQVISRTTMMMYRATPKAVPELVRELGATHVLEGSVRRDGQEVRLNLQLIDARSDSHVWARNYDRKLANVMTLQSQVASEVAAHLALKLSATGRELVPSINPDAYDLYLKARVAARSFSPRTPLPELVRAEEWLNRAIALDDSFAAAYVERFNRRLGKFAYSHDLSDGNLQAARDDLERARKLEGDSVLVRLAESRHARGVELDLSKALALIDTPEMAASNDPDVLQFRGFLLTQVGRFDAALAADKRAAALDPGNRAIFDHWVATLISLRQPADALAVARSFNEHGPGVLDRGALVFAFTGNTSELRTEFDRYAATTDPEAALQASFEVLRYEARLHEFDRQAERIAATTIRNYGFAGLSILGLGRKPVAELTGWARLATGDIAGAARDGRAVLEFVKQEPETKWNAWYLRLLAAEGALFVGDKSRAIVNAREAFAMRRRMTVVPDATPTLMPAVAAVLARILAWAGEKDEAVAMLEELSTNVPGIGPAHVTRDPLYSIPLKDNARYQALEKKLELEIAESQKLFK